MKKTYLRLLSLNLSLLMLLSMLSFTAFASEDLLNYEEELIDSDCAELQHDLRTEKIVGSGIAMAAAVEEKPFRISVGGKSFKSNQITSGNGWSYSDGILQLNNYKGSGITASGDLVIYSEGTVRVDGYDSSYNYGSDGIIGTGTITLHVNSGTINVTGGDGKSYGGTGVIAPAVEILLHNGSANITGGYGIYAGGDAVAGSYAFILQEKENTGEITLLGGDSNIYYDSVGGCGIYGYHVVVGVNGNIDGGDGKVSAPAIYYNLSCKFGFCNLTMCGGLNYYRKYARAIQYGNDADAPECALHTSLSDSSIYTYLKVNQYQLLLFGEGGTTTTGATFTSLKRYYPHSYNLGTYTFEQDGYTQVNWETTASTLLPLDYQFIPEKKTILKARWTETHLGDIIINGLSGVLSGGSNWEKTAAGSMTLPAELNYDNGQSLLAWGSEVVSTPGSLSLLRGTWYAPGSTVEADLSEVTALYARAKGDGAYVIYHPNGAELLDGGNIAVQFDDCESTACATFDILEYTDLMTAPEDYRFGGWATAENGEVAYRTRGSVDVSNGEIIHLYAVWEPLEYKYSSSSDWAVWVDPVSKTLSAEITPQGLSYMGQPTTLVAAAYNEQGKLISCGYEVVSLGSEGCVLKMTFVGDALPDIQLFALNDVYVPTAGNMYMTLSAMTPSAIR